MMISLLAPLSYFIGMTITHFTKEELIARKSWLQYWPYLLGIVPFSMLASQEISIFILCIISYIKASYDWAEKTSLQRRILDMAIIFSMAVIVSYI